MQGGHLGLLYLNIIGYTGLHSVRGNQVGSTFI